MIKRRAKLLRNAVARRAQDWRQTLVGSRQNVLAEMSGDAGYAANFARVKFDAPASRGQIVPVEITGVQEKQLIGRVAA